ncbi:Maf family protein [Endozoicomonadaceae bacterium StTr2]
MIYLASQSPRRAELLQQIGVPFSVSPADIDETPFDNEQPEAYVRRMATTKAQTVWQRLESSQSAPLSPLTPVLAADTSVVIDQQILGKPVDREDGIRMLLQLSDRIHSVLTGVAVFDGKQLHQAVVETRVVFAPIDKALAERYWSTGEPVDKAGGYGIQGKGAVLVERIDGCYSNVVGLPLAETSKLLKTCGVEFWHSNP